MIDIAHLRQWVGQSVTADEVIAPFPSNALAATLDRDDPPHADGAPLPPLGHWLHFLPLHRPGDCGADGHAAKGGFLPPVPLPRRMWAGGSLTFHRDLVIGHRATRRSTIESVDHKAGRTGDLVFVAVRHDLLDAQGVAVEERQNIVYRDIVCRAPPRPGDAPPAPPAAPRAHDWLRPIRPDPMLLFRYSALTFNSHRIHYDRPYAMAEESYPGLVVQGPLIATLLLDGLRRHRPGARVRRFSFRAVSPLFDTASFAVCGALAGTTAQLWAQDASGDLAMEAQAEIA